MPVIIAIVPTVDAISTPLTGRSGLHSGHHVVRHSRSGAVAPLTALHDYNLDEWYYRVTYFAHLPGQFELLKQAHVSVALERRVLVTEREQLRHAQRVIVAKQSRQLAVRLGQRLQLYTKNDIML